jgi:hypothetical protein
VDWSQVWTIIGTLIAAIALQTFWIGRALDDIRARLDRIEDVVLRDHGERIARLEERASS